MRVPSITQERVGNTKTIERVYQLMKDESVSLDEICEKLKIERVEAGDALLVLRSGYGFKIKADSDYFYREDGGQIIIPKYRIKD